MMRASRLGRDTLVVALILGFASPLGAEERTPTVCPICRTANSEVADYPQRAGTTLLRGAMNTAFGWTELLIHPPQEVKTSGNLAVGIGAGMGRAATRTFLGIGEVFTWWLPKGQHGYLKLTTDCPICLGTPQAAPPAQTPAQKPLDKQP